MNYSHIVGMAAAELELRQRWKDARLSVWFRKFGFDLRCGNHNRASLMPLYAQFEHDPEALQLLFEELQHSI